MSNILLVMGSEMSGDSVDEVIEGIFAPPSTLPRQSVPPPPDTQSSKIRSDVRRGLRQIHIQSSTKPVRYPDLAGAFPLDLLAVVPPVVLDANTLRDDILFSADHDARTVLVNAANGGLFRLFCAQHVINEVAEHSGDWTEGTRVSRAAFLTRWLAEYLPAIRVLPDDAVPEELLTPGESARLAELSAHDPDDIPSAKLAIVLGAFYNTRDGPALRAAYGAEVDAAAHDEWRDILRAGGDAGELGTMAQTAYQLVGALAVAGVRGAGNLLRMTGPLVAVPIGIGLYLAYKRIGPETKERIGSGAAAALDTFAEVYAKYCNVRQRFNEAAARPPSWDELATALTPEAVLARACIHTLARTGTSNCSARELRSLLPVLPVTSGEAKVRHVLRSFQGCFWEVYAGHWQVGTAARPVQRLLSERPDLVD